MEMHHWNRRLWRNPSNCAAEIFIKHEIAHDYDMAVAYPLNERFSVYACHHLTLILPLKYVPRT